MSNEWEANLIYCISIMTLKSLFTFYIHAGNYEGESNENLTYFLSRNLLDT